MNRSISVSLSLALHGAVLLGLLCAGWNRPRNETPAGIAVVWVEAGLPQLAGRSRGDAGIADTAESDPAGEALPEAVSADADDDRPAPENVVASDPISGADRPAPPLTRPADENRQRLADGEAIDEDAAAEIVEQVSAAVEQVEQRAEAADESAKDSADDSAHDAPESVAESAEESESTTESADTLQSIVAESADEAPSAVSEPVDKPPVAVAEPVAPSAAPSAEPLEAAQGPPQTEVVSVASAEREMLREDVMDWVNRSRELPSRASAAWSRDGHEYRAELVRVLSAGAMGIEEAQIEISTERNGRHLSTQMRLKRLAFSHYAQLVDRWDPNVQIHDDEIDGRFHSNSEIVISNSGGIQPVFHGSVTTPRGIDTSRSERRVRRHEVFLGGLDTSVPRIALPRRFGPLEAVAAEGTEIIALGADSRISFFADGTYTTEPMDGGGRRRRGRLGTSPAYFLAADKVTVAVQGTVNGKVLVYSPDEIVIEGDLVYAADPTRVAGADDYLGLVADGDVEIAEPEVTGPGDLTVHAAIYAKRRFAVRRYSRHERATLFIHGSLTAGSLSATEPRYRTRLEFDTRLENARPPSFPVTDRYELGSWDGVWRVTE